MDTPYVLLLISQWTTYSFATLLPLNFGMVALFNSDPMGRSQRIFLTSLLYSLKALAEEDERQSFHMSVLFWLWKYHVKYTVIHFISC